MITLGSFWPMKATGDDTARCFSLRFSVFVGADMRGVNSANNKGIEI